jgi:hypothetical protein
MKKIYGTDQLVYMGAGLAENQSMPCILIAPELLTYAASHSEVEIKQSPTRTYGVIEFLPKPRKRVPGTSGIVRSIDIDSGNTRYESIVDGCIACGVTRVSAREFEEAKERLDRKSSDPVAIDRYADGDLIRLYAHRTSSGPGVVIDVLTQRILPNISPPRIALNPFGVQGWQYLSSLFETAAFFWAITEGRRAFLLSSIQEFYPDLIAQVHRRCLQFNRDVRQRSWTQALLEIRAQLGGELG